MDSVWKQKTSKPSISVIQQGGGALRVLGNSHLSCNTKGFGRFDVFQSLFILNLFPTLAEHIVNTKKASLYEAGFLLEKQQGDHLNQIEETPAIQFIDHVMPNKILRASMAKKTAARVDKCPCF